LAETLGIDKAAVHRHLKTLEQGGFVKRYEDHGFVYYGLSWKSRDILSPNDNTKIVILLSASIIFAGVLALVIGMVLADAGTFDAGYRGQDPTADETADYDIREIFTLHEAFPMTAVVTVSLLLGLTLAMVGANRIARRPRQPGMKPEDALQGADTDEE
jgi:DNA-binding transcriptional ArsR family regulator